MSRQKLNPSEAELLSSANEAIKWKAFFKVEDEIPEGWRSREEIQKFTGLGPSQQRQRLREKVLAGKCQVKEFKVFKDGKKLTIPYYFINES